MPIQIVLDPNLAVAALAFSQAWNTVRRAQTGALPSIQVGKITQPDGAVLLVVQQEK